MGAKLNADGAQHQQPQHHHQGEVESVEARCVEEWEGEVERAARRQQPDFIAVPHRTDGADHHAAFLVRARDEQMHRAGAEVEAIQDHT